MNTFVCKICGHIEFENAPEKCPVCGAPKTSFVNKPDAIKAPVDAGNLTESEKKHIPTITIVKACGLIPGVGCTDVHVKTGAIEHPMKEDHYITFIDFYVNKKYIGRASLTPVNLHPAAAFHVNAPGGVLSAVANCNQHGNWMAEAVI